MWMRAKQVAGEDLQVTKAMMAAVVVVVFNVLRIWKKLSVVAIMITFALVAQVFTFSRVEAQQS